MAPTAQHLVIFGCGYVGSAVAREARARGLRVTALTRNEAKAIFLREAGLQVVVADLATNEWHQQVDPAHLVLNAVSSGGGGAEGYRRSYVEGMKSISAWAMLGSPAETMVYTSSTSVYPQGGGVVVDETAATNEADERPRLLVAAENLVRAGDGMAWRRSFVLRLAGIYGPGRTHFVEQVRLGEVAGVPDHHLNLIHRDDIVSAIWACFNASLSQPSDTFNVVDDSSATRAEISAWLAQHLQVPAPRFTDRPASQRMIISPDRVISNAKIKGLLTWQPRHRTFREGYRSVLEGVR